MTQVADSQIDNNFGKSYCIHYLCSPF